MKRTLIIMTVCIVVSILLSSYVLSAPSVPVTFTVLHTNDFHGQLEASGSNPGMARVAQVVNAIRSAKGADNVLLVDAGDEMQGSLLSNLGDGTAAGKGKPTIATFNAMDYDVATFGNHEFDWGQVNLQNRTTEAAYPFVTANIVKNDTGDCAIAGWVKPDFADAPYQIFTIGSAPNSVKVAFIGVTTNETPIITVASATAGLCFKDPADSIIHYYDEMKAAQADVIVVLSHLGYADGGYGYGIPVYGDQTLANRLIAAGKPANLIIGGHSHTNLVAATVISGTTVVQAYYNGRTVGQADITVGTTGTVTTAWSRTTGFTSGAQDPAIQSLVTSFATDPAYLALVNQPIGYSAVDLARSTTMDNMMGTFIDDAVYNYLNTDADATNDIDIFFNNAGGIRTDWCWNGSIWLSTGCTSGTHSPGLLTYGNMFTILPFGNATVVGQMSGAQILEVLNYGPNVSNGVIQTAGLKYKYFSYKDANPGPQPYAWGAFDVTVYNKSTRGWEPLDLKKTYKVGTNEFLAPAGGDGYSAFKYMTNITYWGDMLNAVNNYVSAIYGTAASPYMGPNGDGTLDGRIYRDGTDAGGSIIPLTVLHHNDSHGYLPKGTTTAGYTQLATLIKQEKQHNPTRTLLLHAGDAIQGDTLMYYYRTAPTGVAADGTPLAADMQINPLIKAFNSMGYDAMTLGNHEFNFGREVFKSVLGQATFPLLQANISDSGTYGLDATGPSGIQPFVTKSVGAEIIRVAILGIGNHRVPNYELPSNIPGLTFSNPLAEAQSLTDMLHPISDVVIALSHIGFTENPASAEVDTNVDTNMAATVTGLDAIIGGHSHTNPATASGNFKFLPAIVAGPDNRPVVTSQAYRYNNTLGELVLGLRSKPGGYDVVSQTGRYITVTTSLLEDAAVKAIIDPYVAGLAAYSNQTIGSTSAPIDARTAYTQETNGANLQADAAVHELRTIRGIPVDFHLAGAMSNSYIATSATPATPYTLKVSDMFSAMPYENSLVVLSMNGPQIKAILERGYRNYYYYKYVSGYGGYSYYTTCMLDTDAAGRIVYRDGYPALPDGNNVVSMTVNGVPVNFSDSSTYYNVSTVNYLAMGSCNFNDSGATIWPLDQIVQDTQYYVRDAVIDYIRYTGSISPAIDGRLTYGPLPTVTGITPASGPVTGGTSVTITGTGFTGVTGVQFGAIGVQFSVDTPTQITAVSPPGMGGMIVDVTVTTAIGSSSVSAADQYTFLPLVAKNQTTGTCYTDLSAALLAAQDGNEIRLLYTQMEGDFVLNRNTAVSGGWDPAFLVRDLLPSLLNGSLTVLGGDSTINTMTVKGTLGIKAGCLRVMDVEVHP